MAFLRIKDSTLSVELHKFYFEMKLLYRARKFEDEFFDDYIKRISQKNGFSSIIKFKRELARFYNDNHRSSYRLKPLARDHLSLELILKRNIPSDASRWFRYQTRAMWLNESRVCRSCWCESQYYRFYWWLIAYEKCHIHNELLVSLNSSSEDVSVKGDWLDYGLVIYLIIKRYIGRDSCQSEFFEELEKSECDRLIVVGVRNHFEFDEVVLSAVENIMEAWSSGVFVGLRVDERVEIIAIRLSEYIGTTDFWLRIVALSVLANERGLFIDLPHSIVSEEFYNVSRYIIYSDPLFGSFWPKVEELWEYSQMEDVNVMDFLCGEMAFPDDLICKIKSSLLYSKDVGKNFLNRYSD